MPKVIIVLVNWNGCSDTLACLRSLAQITYVNWSVIVVDNGSTDNSVSAIRAQFPAVDLLEAGENLGFVGGNNLGVTKALETGADYCLLLNNDTEVAPDFLEPLVMAAENDHKVGITGPTIYFYSQPDVIWSAGGGINWNTGETWMIGLNEEEKGQFGCEPRAVEFVTGCALLIKRSVLEQIGLLDPRFFAYFEETEWCVRSARAGYKILHVPQSHLWHKIELEARSTPQIIYYMTRNQLLFLQLGKASWRTWLYVLINRFARTLLSWSLKPRWRNKKWQRNAMLIAIRDYFWGRFGRVTLS